MNLKSSSIYLAIIFFLVALVSCLVVMVLLLVLTREGPLLNGPQQSTPAVVLAPTMPMLLFTPTPIDILIPPSSPRSTPFHRTEDSLALSLATRVVVIITPTIPPATNTPRPTATARPPTDTPGPSPTPTYPNGLQYEPDGPVQFDKNRGCLGGAIYGTIRDAQGNPVEGLRVKVYNEYVTDYSAPSKPVSAPDAGFYDFIINPKPQSWKVVVVDGANNPISPEVDVVRPDGEEICYFEVDWKAVR